MANFDTIWGNTAIKNQIWGNMVIKYKFEVQKIIKSFLRHYGNNFQFAILPRWGIMESFLVFGFYIF